MFKTQCVLAFVVLYVGLAHSWSWDIVLGVQNKLEFYGNGTLTHTEDLGPNFYVSHVTYDVIHNRLLITDINSKSDYIIYSFNIATKEIRPLVKRERGGIIPQSYIFSLAYDPVVERIFWTDYGIIYYFDLKSGSQNNAHGNVLLEFDDSIPWSVAVDSCRGHIYWTNVYDRGYSWIERSDFKGDQRKVIMNENLRAVHNLVVDQHSQRMYWTDEVSGVDVKPLSINSAFLNGGNRTTLYFDPENEQPEALAVSKDFIYWLLGFDVNDKIFYLPKYSNEHTKPKAISVKSYYRGGFATNYKIHDQIQGIKDCPRLKHKLQNTTKSEEPKCQNYCLQGDCSVSNEGQAVCRCEAGFSGRRCEVDECQGYCLNNGICSINTKNGPVCKCERDYAGGRCELPLFLEKCFETISMLRDILNADVSSVKLDKSVKPTCATNIV